jgi:hypothetical protein
MRLVDDVLDLGTERIFVARPMMTAELQVTAGGEYDANVGLSVAAIAAIGGAQLGGRQRRGHGTSSLGGGTLPPRVHSLTRHSLGDTLTRGRFATGEILGHPRAVALGPPPA